ncbi:MAG: decaprenyl-phosphate phosphoribosyltransferase [Patescibacteria group bacterium]
MNKDLNTTVVALVTSFRPHQWLKNAAVGAPAFFWGVFFDRVIFFKVLAAALNFCILSSAIYLINDVFDIPRDRAHPLKKHRPIASGKISSQLALSVAAVILGISFLVAYFLSFYYFTMIFSYALLQFAYNLFLRDVIILDALAIALGFIFRVFAGALVIPVPVSSWFVLSTIGVSLLMAFGKRKSEKTIFPATADEGSYPTRRSLRNYPDTLLDSAISTFSAFTILSYSLFTFQTSPKTSLSANLLPATLAQPKWMMLTIPIVIYGISRYLYVIYEKREGETPAKVLLADTPLLLAVLFWIASVGAITYLLG